ncbi:polysaccharide deacetylase family protein [bacterium]|nr:polysaccharide deacetylase family protein [bacterium]
MGRPQSFLFSIDLEDIRARLPDGHTRPARVTQNTQRFLAFLRGQRARCTFFVVGELADAEPDLIAAIMEEGHEIGCHTHAHTPLDRFHPDGFRRDLEQNLRSLERVGVESVKGFRAPCGSLIPSTAWVYPILKEFGFTYSSSVIPARNPIFGWPGFGLEVRKVEGIWEIPISLTELPGFRIPYASGVYFRVLPLPLVAWGFRWSLWRRGFVTSYFHPYDVDTEEDPVEVPELKGNRFHNWLFYYNRRDVFRRLEQLARKYGPSIRTYEEFVEQLML